VRPQRYLFLSGQLAHAVAAVTAVAASGFSNYLSWRERMNRSAAIIGVAMTLLACAVTLTAPPSGLPVVLSFLTTPTTSATVAGAGDSAVVTLPIAWLDVMRCGSSLSRAAGIVGARVIVTVIVTDPNPNVGYACVRAPDPPLLTARAVVHGIPVGRFAVVLVRRGEHWSGPPTEEIVARGSVDLP
jgi:hypothetical protein